MPRSKPTLGYPSRTAAAMALHGQGFSSRQIAAKIGVAQSTAAALLHSGRRGRPARPAERNGRTVVIPNDILTALDPDAKKRGISVNELIRRIVDIVAEERMTDAILDDQEAFQ